VYHGKRHPRELDSDDVRQFLTFLATELHVAVFSQDGAAGSQGSWLHKPTWRPRRIIRALNHPKVFLA